MSTPLRERPDAPLGTLIFRAGLLPAETIESALEEGVKTGKRLGEILTERGLLKEVDLARLLAGQKGLEFVPVREHIVDPAAASLFTHDQARLFRALPYAFEDGIPIVAIPDPTDEVLLRNVREALGRDEVRFVVSTRGELAELVEDVYSRPLAAPDPVPTEPAASPPAAPETEPEFVRDPEPASASEPEERPDHGGNGNGTLPEGVAAAEAGPIAPVPAAEPAAPPEVAVAAEEERTFSAPAAPIPAVPQPFAEPEPAAPAEQPLVPEPAASVEPAVAAAPEPVSRPEPVPAPEPFALPEHAPPSATAPAPVPLPEPALPPAPAPYPPAVSAPPITTAPPPPAGTRYDVTIRLTNGERVEAGAFQELDAAKERAKALMIQVAAAAQGEWPFVSGRFLKPDTIVSVDISEPAGSGPAPTY